MLTRRQRGWELPERLVTPEAIVARRRDVVKGLAALSGMSMAGVARAVAPAGDPSTGLYPVKRSDRYRVDRPITDEKLVTSFNNFCEFGFHKRIAKAAQALPIRPWTIKIDGQVEKEQELDIDTLLRQMPLEERVYRHRCVETWSFVAPWSGFPLAALLDLARPTSAAKFVRLETFNRPDVAPGQRAFWYPWPYNEVLTMPEAGNELAFMVTGAYGRPLEKQNGAPLRLAVPWKYGFKSIKSIVKITFLAERPKTFWEEIDDSEYGFWANVNPEVDHPRWSQATENTLGSEEERPTELFNGYAEFVAHLYPDLTDPSLFR